MTTILLLIIACCLLFGATKTKNAIAKILSGGVILLAIVLIFACSIL